MIRGSDRGHVFIFGRLLKVIEKRPEKARPTLSQTTLFKRKEQMSLAKCLLEHTGGVLVKKWNTDDVVTEELGGIVDAIDNRFVLGNELGRMDDLIRKDKVAEQKLEQNIEKIDEATTLQE